MSMMPMKSRRFSPFPPTAGIPPILQREKKKKEEEEKTSA